MQITWTDTWTQEHRNVRTHSSAPALSIMPQPVLSAYCVPSTVSAVTLSLERQHSLRRLVSKASRRQQATGWVGLRQDGKGPAQGREWGRVWTARSGPLASPAHTQASEKGCLEGGCAEPS